MLLERTSTYPGNITQYVAIAPSTNAIADGTLALVGERDLISYRRFYDLITANRDATLARHETLFAECAYK
jgi:hypothetical protein